MVAMRLPATEDSRVMQECAGAPSKSTVQAP